MLITNWEHLSTQQQELNDHIIEKMKTRGETIDYTQLLSNFLVAYKTELFEAINKTNCFKHWKQKDVDVEELIDEAADVLHFYITLHLYNQTTPSFPGEVATEPTTSFDLKKRSATRFTQYLTVEFPSLDRNVETAFKDPRFREEARLSIDKTFHVFLSILAFYDVTIQDIYNGYWIKHDENYRRQETNY